MSRVSANLRWLYAALPPAIVLAGCLPSFADEPLPDPIPLRRQVLPLERLRAELDRVERGILTRMPRREFEQLVQRAAQATQQLKGPPRLIHASYRATLRDGALVGTGEWRIINPSPGPALLPIQPFNLAMQKCRIQSGSAETADAVIAAVEGGSLGMLTQSPGEHTVYLDWSARGNSDGGILNFALQVPAATTASIELNVPVNQVVTSERGQCRLTGPHPAETPDRTIWRVDFPAVSMVKFSLVQKPDSLPRSPVLADVSETHEIGTDSVRSEFGFSFHSGTIPIGEFRLEYPASLSPYEVDTLEDRCDWEVASSPVSKNLSTLRIRFREPLRSGSFTVRCLAPHIPGQRWACPDMHLMDVIPKSETIRFRVSPDVRLDDWNPGSYGIRTNDATEDGWQTLTLSRRAVSVDGNARRPECAIRIRRPAVRATTATLTSKTVPEVPTSSAVDAPPTTGLLAIENASLDTALLSDGSMIHTYRFDVSNRHDSDLEVRLPSTVTPLSAKVEGRLIPDSIWSESPDGRTIRMPVGRRVELVYRSSLPKWNHWARMEAPMPEFPTPPASVQHSWKLPDGTEPFTEMSFMNDEWTTANAGSATGLVVVRRSLIVGTGIVLAGILSLLAFALRECSGGVRLGVLAFWACIGVGGTWWLPGSLRPLFLCPLLVCGVAVGGWWAWTLGWKNRWLARIASPVVLAVLATGLVAQAPRLNAWPVYIVPDPTRNSDKESVLVEPELLEKLRAIILRAASPVSRPVLTAARYTGSADGLNADVRAEYQVYNPSDGIATLVVPLSGVRLREALLDGAPVNLTHRRAIPPRFPEVYLVEVMGKGFHRLTVRFAVDGNARGEERDVRWNIPEVIQTRLEFEISGPIAFARAVAHLGTAVTSDATPSSTPKTRFEADLGRVNNVHLRWRCKAVTDHSPVISVREAYLWSLTPASKTLSALWHYTVDTGAVDMLQVEVPETLDVMAVEVHRLPSEGLDGARPALRNWSVSTISGRKILRLNLMWPMCQGVQVFAHFVSQRTPIAKDELPLPTLINVAPGDSPSYVAYSSAGIRAGVGNETKGITKASPASFLDFWGRTRKADVVKRLQVFHLDRKDGPASVPVVFEPLPLAVQAVQQLTWSVDDNSAEFRLSAELTELGPDASFLEWEMPPDVIIGNVSGPEVRSWSRSESKLQVWLNSAVTQTRIEVSGLQKLNSGATEISLPRARLVSAPSCVTFVQVHAREELTLTPVRLQDLWPLPTNKVQPNRLEFATDAADYGATFRFAP